MEKVSIEAIECFLSKRSGYGYGSGSGDGSGDGDGYGNGNGYGDGYGYGSGYGNGDGDGYGYGDGYGDGYGYGSGDGDGSGYGNGNGDGVKEINGQRVYKVDGVPTIFEIIHGNYAKGYILKSDLTLKPCYIAKYEDYFAHGETVDGVPTIFESIHGNYAKGYILKSDLTLKPCYIAKYEDYFAHGETLREAQAGAHAKALREMTTEERLAAFKEAHPDTEHRYPAADLFEWHGILTGSCNMGRRHFCDERGIDAKKDAFTVCEFIEMTKDSFGRDVIAQLKEVYNL